MKKKSTPFWFLFFNFLIILSFPDALQCQEEIDDERWGFFWYNDRIKEEEINQAEQTKKKEIYPPLKPDNLTYTDLWDIHPDRFKKIIDTRLKLAVQHPTESNVLRYIEAQDVAKRKSLAFTASMQFVAQKHPEYDEDAGPLNVPGKAVKRRIQWEKEQKILHASKDGFGLIFFVDPSCHYCETQRPVVEQFKFDYDWLVEKLHISENAELAKRYDINKTPAIIIVAKKNGAALSISRGVIPLSELRDRVINAVLYLNGKNRRENFIHNLATDPLKFKKSK
jgi:conjugal transfer pilus assembly protein TraF